jgi:integral membrane protein (TIGR01906 family)
MNKLNQCLSPFLSWLVAILVPITLMLLGMRLLLTPAFVNLEYRMPGFPADPYGFSQTDRLHWSKIALQYLLNDSDISYLGDLHFADGSPVYNERELSHMSDVKNVVKAALKLFYFAIGTLAVLVLWAWQGNWMSDYKCGLQRGGWLTIGLMGAILLFALVSFWNFFVLFHELFFQGNSWLFLYSDTLIRLFPLRFWQDVFLFEGLLVLGGAIGLALGLRPSRR